MIIYDLKIEKYGSVFCYGCSQFPTIKGFGLKEIEACRDLFSKIHNELNRIIKEGKHFPNSVSPNQITKGKKGVGSFQFPLTVELTMHLHTLMLSKNISPASLARLFALTNEEVKLDDWQLSETLKIEPKALPKYKKVQRLLNVLHDSSITEMAEAFRVLDCYVGIHLIDKNSLQHVSKKHE